MFPYAVPLKQRYRLELCHGFLVSLEANSRKVQVRACTLEAEIVLGFTTVYPTNAGAAV
jgi:hypothetical protein